MTEIPNAFGGFAPFPNTIMIPTMGLQSAVIGYRFGFGYEQGKRAVRKMSNEEFNNLDEEAEQAMFKRHDSSAINYFKTEMVNWVNLQNLIIEKSVEIEVAKAIRTPSAFREMFEGFTKGFSDQQTKDAGDFFASLEDIGMKILAWFSGHKPSTQVTQETTQVSESGRRRVSTSTPSTTIIPTPTSIMKRTSVWPAVKNAPRKLVIEVNSQQADLLIVQYKKARDNAEKIKSWLWYHHMRENIRILEALF